MVGILEITTSFEMNICALWVSAENEKYSRTKEKKTTKHFDRANKPVEGVEFNLAA